MGTKYVIRIGDAYWTGFIFGEKRDSPATSPKITNAYVFRREKSANDTANAMNSIYERNANQLRATVEPCIAEKEEDSIFYIAVARIGETETKTDTAPKPNGNGHKI